MQEHSDWFRLFNAYWWLIFPLFGMGFGMVQAWLRHKRAQQRLEILKSYIDQGKEPPPELVQFLRAPERQRDKGPGGDIFLTILFTGIGLALTFLAINEGDKDIYFPVIIMGALAVGFLAKALLRPKQERLDPP